MNCTATLKTVVHNYRFDMTTKEGKADYKALCVSLKAKGLRVFDGIGDYRNPKLAEREIELETTCLFDNQWNTAPIEGVSDNGLRVFDWAEDCLFIDGHRTTNTRKGYWLEQTTEMAEIRRNTHKCGYCGKQEPAAKGYVFCPHCLDSEYLTIEDLKKGATRMQPITHGLGGWSALTEGEAANLVPQYKEAQLHGSTERGKARIAKKRADIKTTYENALETAEAEYVGYTWLMDNGVNTDNAIYYKHTKKFAFGWRTPITDPEMKAEMEQILKDFPYHYEIVTKSK